MKTLGLNLANLDLQLINLQLKLDDSKILIELTEFVNCAIQSRLKQNTTSYALSEIPGYKKTIPFYNFANCY